MNQRIGMFGVAIFILILITAVILAVAAGPTHPLTWGLILFLFSIPFLHRKLTERHYLVWSDDYSVGIDS
ncbi:MAG TPA: hypothetical protein ENK53_00170, partial [Thiotrichales bacterium]|nr:hypothetical protein [Thiotrichales bacterium]